ncbi:MAG TPA: hypothetical protein VNO33_06435 [Kofleriaceae bacterium]|nr:hypothetical protein [Kofleriaceae bacterium]
MKKQTKVMAIPKAKLTQVIAERELVDHDLVAVRFATIASR